MSPLTQALASFHPVSVEIIVKLDGLIRSEVYPKGHQLLPIGSIARKMYFIETGVARVFYLRNGQDVTDYFGVDGQFIGAVESVFTKQPSHKGMEILEDNTRLSSMRYAEFEQLCEEYHEVETIGKKLAIFAFLEGQRRIESIRFLSAAERYHELEKKYPGLTNRIPLKHIASYLGTTQVSLSRIRAGQQ